MAGGGANVTRRPIREQNLLLDQSSALMSQELRIMGNGVTGSQTGAGLMEGYRTRTRLDPGLSQNQDILFCLSCCLFVCVDEDHHVSEAERHL